MMRVYMAGGLHSGWQDELFELMAERQTSDERIDLIDPREHGLTDEREYTAWDLAAIRSADAVVANIEPDNPYMCAGLMLEIGYAHAIGKLVVLVDWNQHKAHGMARAVADVRVTDLHGAARFLLALAGG